MIRTNVLVGKSILKVLIAEDRLALRFICEDGDFIARCDADCCSYTWIESVENTVISFPATVISVENLEMNKENSWEEDGHECVAFYGCKITTDRGFIVIDYRNDSNGYYGGDLKWPGDSYYGGVHDQSVSKNYWQELPEYGDEDES